MTVKTSFSKWGDEWTLQERTKTHALYKRVGACGRHWEVVGIGKVPKEYKFPNGKVLVVGQEFLKLSDSNYGTNTWCFKEADKAKAKFEEVAHG